MLPTKQIIHPIVIQNEWFWGKSLHVITNDGKAHVKMVINNVDKQECDIWDLVTHTSAQKQGYAKMLMSEVEKIAREMDIHRLYLWVDRKSWMREWYQRLGFETEELRKPPNPNVTWMVKFLKIPTYAINPKYQNNKNTIL